MTLPPLPEVNYLGDDVSYGYDACDMREYGAACAAAYKTDAERYRWLRSQDWFSGPLSVVRNPKSAVKPGHDCPSGGRLDEAIDAAIRAQG